MKLIWWWQRRHAPAGFARPHVLNFLATISSYGFKPMPLERWPDGWVSLRIGKWHVKISFSRYRKLPDFNPADYDSVP